MSSSIITIPFSPQYEFETLLDAQMALIQKLMNMTFNFKNTRVDKLSFVDYANRRFHENFPFNKPLTIHNTSTIDKFGYGRYTGFFFDVIVRLEDGNPMNWRIFYGVDEAPPAPGPETVFILGQDRPLIKKGRTTYIEYEGKLISLTAAKKLAKPAAKI